MILTTGTFDFTGLKPRIDKLQRVVPESYWPFTIASKNPYAFITHHYRIFMADKLAIDAYPASICELLCYFISKCDDFVFSLDDKPFCFAVVDIAEREKSGDVITCVEYSRAISTLYCELLTNRYPNPNDVLTAFVEAIEKDAYHLSNYTNWLRTDPPEDDPSKPKPVDEDYEEWKKHGKRFTYRDRYTRMPFICDNDREGGAEQQNIMRLSRILRSDEFKNENTRRRELELFKMKFSPTEFDDLMRKVNEFNSSMPGK